MTQWTRLDSTEHPAPRDGTIIDLWCPSIGRLTDQWWDDGGWVGLAGSGLEATHWMPLPGPPPDDPTMQAIADSALYGTGYLLTKADGNLVRIDPFDLPPPPKDEG